MPEATIKHRAFAYYADEEGLRPDGTVGDIRVERIARRGDTIELDDVQYQRGNAHGAFVTDEDRAAQEATGEQELVIETATVQQLAEWIEEDKPNVNDTVGASGGDAAVAARIMEAENMATGGKPRSGVVEGLTKVISDGNA